MADGVKKEWLDGLKFRDRKATTEVVGGRRKVTYTAVERPLRTEDVLNFTETETSVVLVTADGQKLTVAKKAEKKDPPK